MIRHVEDEGLSETKTGETRVKKTRALEDENEEELLETKRGETRGKKTRTLEDEKEEPLDEEELRS